MEQAVTLSQAVHSSVHYFGFLALEKNPSSPCAQFDSSNDVNSLKLDDLS